MTTYETGATTHAVNDLILFTDNTRQTAELRDSIYSYMRQADLMDKSKEWDTLYTFTKLFESARKHYINEHQYTGSGHIIRMTSAEVNEYCSLYMADFENWKIENPIK